MPRPIGRPNRPHTSPVPSDQRSLIPVGMATILPHTAQRVRHLEAVLLTVLSRWGYQEIIPPTFEYLDVLSSGLEPELIEKCYKFADQTTGRILLLRPDVTAQIARIVAMGMVEASVPLRLCYRSTVFRYEPEHAGREREIFQVGAELIGVDGVSADGEIIALMIDCLKQLGLVTFTVSLGHVGFFQALLASSGLSPEGQKRAEHAAARKDLSRLDEILTRERVAKSKARVILEVPSLYGREQVLERGREIAGRDRELRATLERLTKVYRLLKAAGLHDRLLLDLGEFRGFDYYDGVAFDVFAEGIGSELGGGGRYNHLIGRFGRALPSTGFALDVDRLFQALKTVGERQVHERVDFLISAPVRSSDRVFQVSQMLRQSGFRVTQGVLRHRGDAGIREAIEEGQKLKARVVAVLGETGMAPDEARVVAWPVAHTSGGSRSSARKVLKIKELSTLL